MTRVRVELQAPPDYRRGVTAACIWVDWTEDGDTASLRLLYDYPATDLSPEKGWRVRHAGVMWSVTGVDGRTLALARVAAEEEE